MRQNRKFPWEKLEKRFDTVHIKSVGETLTAKNVSTPAKIYVTRKFGSDAVVACTTVPDGVVVTLAYVPNPSNPVAVSSAPTRQDVRAQLEGAPEFDEEYPDPDALEEA